MGAAIGGRHIVVEATTIPTPRRTVALTGAMVIILMRRLTMTTTLELTGRKAALTARTDRRPLELVTIHTLGRTLEEHQSRHLMAAGAPRRHTIRTPAPMRRRDKVQVPQPSGAALMCREETRALLRAITPPLMEQWLVPRLRREEKRLPPVRSGETALLVKLQAVICMLAMMVTFIRTPVMAGKSTTTAVGIR